MRSSRLSEAFEIVGGGGLIQFTEDNLEVHSNSKINDELRFSIIDAVYLRPAIWDHGRELKSLGVRKDLFIEIAALLSTKSNILSCQDIEKQWKNLKDSYFKLRKKAKKDESGKVIPPRWKFFSSLQFLDKLLEGSEVAETSTAVDEKWTMEYLYKKRRLSNTALGGHIAKNAESGGQIDVESDSVDEHLAYRQQVLSAASPIQAVTEDEYSAFCISLIYPLREIGNWNRLELLQLQKQIRDLIHEKQIERLQSESLKEVSHLL